MAATIRVRELVLIDGIRDRLMLGVGRRLPIAAQRLFVRLYQVGLFSVAACPLLVVRCIAPMSLYIVTCHSDFPPSSVHSVGVVMLK